MATLIRATCGECGDVELGTRDLLVRLCEDTESGTYVFRCPNCAPGRAPRRPFRRSTCWCPPGCRLEVWNMPAELLEPRPPRATTSPTTT